jgi:hypothetical protein
MLAQILALVIGLSSGARAKNLSPKERSESTRKAAKARLE